MARTVLLAIALMWLPGAVGSSAAQPRLQDQPPAFFCCGGKGVPDVWVASDLGGGSLSIYPFEPFRGNFRDAFTRTLFSERIAFAQREVRLVSQPEANVAAVRGADAAMSLSFRALDGQGRLIEHVRVAILAANHVALVDFAVQVDRTPNVTRSLPSVQEFFRVLAVVTDATPGLSRAYPLPNDRGVPPGGSGRAMGRIPTLRYGTPPLFCCGGRGDPDVWVASVAPGDGGILSIYAFAPFVGDFRSAVLRTRFAERIAFDKREAGLASQPDVRVLAVAGAQEALLIMFAGRDTSGQITQHARLAVSSGNAVAIVDFVASNWQTSVRTRQAFADFLTTLSVVEGLD